VASKVAPNLDRARKEEDLLDACTARKAHAAQMMGTMKWMPFQTSFLEKMCDIIKTSVHTDKGFKEVHLTYVSNALFEHCRAEVTSTKVYNHLRKWRTRWIHVSKLRDLTGAQWDEDNCIIMLEADHYQGHIMVSTVLHLSFDHLCPLLTVFLAVLV
jgi:hypothetical protein